MLAIGPGDPLDGHAAARAVDASHAVQQEHRNGPQWDELESPLAQRVVLVAFATALAADRSAPPVSPDVNEDFVALFSQTGVAVNETFLLSDAVEDILAFRISGARLGDVLVNTINTRSADKMLFLIAVALAAFIGAGRRSLTSAQRGTNGANGE